MLQKRTTAGGLPETKEDIGKYGITKQQQQQQQQQHHQQQQSISHMD